MSPEDEVKEILSEKGHNIIFVEESVNGTWFKCVNCGYFFHISKNNITIWVYGENIYPFLYDRDTNTCNDFIIKSIIK